MAIVTVGIDLAKNDFALHGVDELLKPVLVRREAHKLEGGFKFETQEGIVINISSNMPTSFNVCGVSP
jgi:hypothetical protein